VTLADELRDLAKRYAVTYPGGPGDERKSDLFNRAATELERLAGVERGVRDLAAELDQRIQLVSKRYDDGIADEDVVLEWCSAGESGALRFVRERLRPMLPEEKSDG
jgi:hypothetical protein